MGWDIIAGLGCLAVIAIAVAMGIRSWTLPKVVEQRRLRREAIIKGRADRIRLRRGQK